MLTFTNIKLVGIFSVLTCFAFSTEVSEQFNAIDTFTSASIYHSLKIRPSKVYKNYAVITWNEDWKDEHKVIAYKLRWGTQEGVFTDSLNLKGYINEVDNIDTIKPLQENTPYYAQFYRDFNHELFLTDFRFNTPPLPTIQPVSIKHKQMSLNSKNSPIFTTIAFVEIYSASGRLLSRAAFNPKGGTVSMETSISAPGLYVAYLKNRNNKIVLSKKLVVNK